MNPVWIFLLAAIAIIPEAPTPVPSETPLQTQDSRSLIGPKRGGGRQRNKEIVRVEPVRVKRGG